MVNRMQFYIDGAWVDPAQPPARLYLPAGSRLRAWLEHHRPAQLARALERVLLDRDRAVAIAVTDAHRRPLVHLIGADVDVQAGVAPSLLHQSHKITGHAFGLQRLGHVVHVDADVVRAAFPPASVTGASSSTPIRDHVPELM